MVIYTLRVCSNISTGTRAFTTLGMQNSSFYDPCDYNRHHWLVLQFSQSSVINFTPSGAIYCTIK